MSASEPDDKSLWQQALEGVEPLSASSRVRPEPSRLHEARQFSADEAQVMPDAMDVPHDPDEFAAGDEAEFRRPGINRQQLRRLRRGEFSIQATVDLHGLTRIEAATEVRDLLERADQRGWRCVKIIHGKGLRSPQGRPILKSRVETALRRNDQVLAYATAPPWSGGHGAMLVLLRQRN